MLARMTVLDVLVKVSMGVALTVAVVVWALAFTGRYRPKVGPPEARAKADRAQPYLIGLFALAALLDLVTSDSRSQGGFLLAVFALLGWMQDRVRLRAAEGLD